MTIKTKSISEFAGAWSNMSDAEADELKETIKEIRKRIHGGLIRNVPDKSR